MRADVFLASGGYAPSREQAKRLILEGLVTVDGKPLRRAAEEIGEGAHTVTVSGPERFVSRGGNKLEAALAAFGLNPSGWRALDIGASTGGFTDCLLRHGVAEVVAVDSGAGQLAEALRGDPRVRSREHCNARDLTAETIGGRVRLIVMDVSFISATLILPRFPALLESVGDAVCLIKPQFEVGRANIGKGGLVRDPRAHQLVAVEGGDQNRSALADQLICRVGSRPQLFRNVKVCYQRNFQHSRLLLQHSRSPPRPV